MLLPPDSKEDVDRDSAMRKRVAEWAGRDVTSVPATFDAEDRRVLDEVARLAYCPRCWDDDVASGRAPYVRRIWSRWTTVSCGRHKTWLTARRPRIKKESLRNGWEGAWQSNQQWANASNLKHDPLMTVTANAFAPDTFAQPDLDWETFEHAVVLINREQNRARLLGAGSVLQTAISSEFFALRTLVLASMQTQPPAMRINDIDLQGYRRAEPGWIANRIACMVIAIELVRMLSRQEPIFLDVRTIMERSACAKAWVSSTATPRSRAA